MERGTSRDTERSPAMKEAMPHISVKGISQEAQRPRVSFSLRTDSQDMTSHETSSTKPRTGQRMKLTARSTLPLPPKRGKSIHTVRLVSTTRRDVCRRTRKGYQKTADSIDTAPAGGP